MPSEMVTWLFLHWQNMHSLQAMAWTSVRQRCSTATHTLQHGACLRVGTFSEVRTSSTENGVTFLRCARHSWTETYHSQILATSLYYHAHCLNIYIPPSPPPPSPIILVMSKVEYYFNVIHSSVIHSHHHQLSPITSCHLALFKQCALLVIH